MEKKHVGVLMGGMSAERDVSVMSGEAVVAALSERGYPVTKIFVDEDVDQVLRQTPIDVAFLALHGTLRRGRLHPGPARAPAASRTRARASSRARSRWTR